MARVLRFLIALFVISLAAAWIAEQSGRLSLTWGAYRIDTSVAVLLAAVVGVAIAAALFYQLWLLLVGAPTRLKELSRERRRRRGYLALTQGLVAVAAGDAKEAARQVKRADGLLGDPTLTLLLSAQAAQLQGDDAAAERFFEAMRRKPETAFLGLRGLLNQTLKRGGADRALLLAREAHRLRPDSPWVGEQLFALETRAGRWTDAQATLRDWARKGGLAPERAGRLTAALEHVQSLEAEERGDAETALKQARKAVTQAPDFTPAAAHLVRLWAAAGKPRAAMRVLENAWRLAPHPDLIEALRVARPPADALAWVTSVQRLVAARPEDAESRLAIAEAALDADLWGEARGQLQPLLSAEPEARACRLMARLEEAERQDMGAAHAWLARASTAGPDPAWVCAECRTPLREWRGLCPTCGAFASLQWGRPWTQAAALSEAAPLRALPAAESTSVVVP